MKAAFTQRGSTLIEMLTVIVILGILLALAAPYVIGDMHRSQDTETKHILALAFEQVKKQAETTTPADCSPNSPPCVFATDSTRQSLQVSFPTVRFNDGLPAQASAQIGQIGVETDAQNEAVLCVKSDSGNFFSIRYVSNGTNAGAYYGAGDSCTDGSTPATPGIPYDTSSGPNPTPAAQGANESTNDEWSSGTGAPASGGGGGSGGSDVANPVNLTPPVISGNPGDSPGSLLSASTGSWDPGYPPVSYTYQWYRNGASIPGATANTYITTASDMNTNLTVQVTATTAAGGQTTVTSNSFLVANPPSGASGSNAPSIAGTPQDQQTLNVSPGNWSGTPPFAYSYQWEVSTDGTSNWAAINGASGQSYTIPSALVGDYLRATVTATNSAGSSMATSASTAQITAAPPVNAGGANAPSVSGSSGGTLYQGDTVTADHGSWSGTGPFSYSYQWKRCDASGNNCVSIGGATSSTYTTTNTDIGSTIVVMITASGPGGSSSASSTATVVVAARPPTNTGVPAISGSPIEGGLFTSSNGTWTGTTPITFTYQWQRCDENGSSCAAIGGATASSYAATSSDRGHELRLVVTGTNGGGSALATSDASPLIGAASPSAVTAPTLSYPDGYNPARDGDHITTTNGTWSGTSPYGYSYDWQRCDASGSNCSSIAGAGSAELLVNGGCESGTGSWTTVNDTLTQVSSPAAAGGASCQLVASGSGTFGTNQSATVSGATAGRIWDGAAAVYASGSTVGKTFQLRLAEEGGSGGAASTSATVTMVAGWNYLTVARTFTANDRTAAHLYAEILGGAASDKVYFDLGYLSEDRITYTLAATDIGSTIRAQVTATNAAGSTTATSAASSVIAYRPPANTSAPTISDTTVAGRWMQDDSASSTTGSWSGSPTISYSYQWQRSPDGSSGWTNITGATSSTYAIAQADVGNYIRSCVTATNPGGNALSCSSASARVVAEPPSNTATPSVSGTVQDGQTVSGSTGSWTGTPTITYAYQWQTSPDSATWSDISGATASSYSIPYGTYPNYLRLKVTATNSAGSVSAYSSSAPVSAAPPTNVAAPVESGTAQVSSTLSVTTGSWVGTPTITYTYQWQTSANGTSGWSNIAGATASTYALQSSDIGNYVRANVTATSPGGSTSQPSNSSTQVIGVPPSNTVAPTESGTAKPGQTLTAAPGSWTGTAPITYSYQWQRCDESGANCTDISGATSSTYAIQGGDALHQVRAAVTATNGAGSTTAYSSASATIPTFVASGGTMTTITGYEIHTFTSSGTFTISAGSGNVEVLVIGGGGGGGTKATSGVAGGGGGGGAYYNSAYALSPGSFSVTVGGGGANASPGSSSSFNGLTAGGGAAGLSNTGTSSGGNSGSGYGGGSGNGAGICSSTGEVAGGGGGAGGGGSTGYGGTGYLSSISGSSTYYGGGGGGGTSQDFNCGTSLIHGTGGAGGGGTGAYNPINAGGATGPSAGTANTGGGGGGGSNNCCGIGAAGGSGIVVVRFRTS